MPQIKWHSKKSKVTKKTSVIDLDYDAEYATDNLNQPMDSWWIWIGSYIFLTIFFLWGLFKLLFPWLKDVNRNDVFVWIVGIWYIVLKVLQRPLYIWLWLYLLYRLVRFIKRAWNNDK
jgi:hypothetical protein